MNHNLAKTITQALTALNPRGRDIIQLRYGLKNAGGRYTLAAIGKRYGVTRERVRQIEAQALRALRAQFSKPEFANVYNTLTSYLEKNNGVRSHALVVKDLGEPDAIIRTIFETSGIAQFHMEDKNNYAFWSLSENHLKQAERATADLIANLKAKKNGAPAIPTDPAYQNYISISKKFAVSPYGEFGLAEWRDINPRVSRDWAYLVLRKAQKPLHFSILTAEINKLRPNKKINAQTTHNELIKDKRFILVGRGMYGLPEFNIMPGTAREVLETLLKKNGPMPAKELVQLALSKRPFKEKTLLINLQNKNWFKREDGGKYFVRKA